eukprot:Lankesteria_metandrocarpae@DN60_c0_g1_i1.p1
MIECNNNVAASGAPDDIYVLDEVLSDLGGNFWRPRAIHKLIAEGHRCGAMLKAAAYIKELRRLFETGVSGKNGHFMGHRDLIGRSPVQLAAHLASHDALAILFEGSVSRAELDKLSFSNNNVNSNNSFMPSAAYINRSSSERCDLRSDDDSCNDNVGVAGAFGDGGECRSSSSHQDDSTNTVMEYHNEHENVHVDDGTV